MVVCVHHIHIAPMPSLGPVLSRPLGLPRLAAQVGTNDCHKGFQIRFRVRNVLFRQWDVQERNARRLECKARFRR